jgi:hypothetical protein
MTVKDCPESAFQLIILINQNDGCRDPECQNPGTKIELINSTLYAKVSKITDGSVNL